MFLLLKGSDRKVEEEWESVDVGRAERDKNWDNVYGTRTASFTTVALLLGRHIKINGIEEKPLRNIFSQHAAINNNFHRAKISLKDVNFWERAIPRQVYLPTSCFFGACSIAKIRNIRGKPLVNFVQLHTLFGSALQCFCNKIGIAFFAPRIRFFLTHHICWLLTNAFLFYG